MPNDTEAPTSGATQGAEEQTKATLLSIDQLDFVTLIGQHYGKYGSLLTADLAFERYNVPTDKFRKWMGQDKVRAAIKQQGIELDKFEAAITDPDSWNAHALTPVQLAVANVMTD